ncbi:hypothetical protein [Salinicoccus albus]|uniref:hypothetical protein n=1 Tax=Salinicoccus albus TaxID=418756 RepID=UPI0003741888|nr:hypothetical protein [Salinicoccus albus]
MVKVYESMRDKNGDTIKGRTKLFVVTTDNAGSLLEHQAGTAMDLEDSGSLFIVDDWLLDQVHKLQLLDGQLVVKDGETLEEPVKSEKEIKREELLKQLAELDAMENKM